jgi:ABC-2 type transport system ATP-binding protein
MNFEAKNPLVPIIQITELDFSFGKRKVLNGINLEVKQGEIFGLLGPNGSGKSTLLYLIAGLLKRKCGTIAINGHEIPDALPYFRRQIGMVFQNPGLDLKLTARENLQLTCLLYGIPKYDRKEIIEQQLDFSGLRERGNERVSKFSGGMRRRLEIARALVHEPSILLLDEPTVGLDEEAFRDTWLRLELFRKSRDLTVIISTHKSEEGQRCNRVAILSEGKILTIDPPQILKQSLTKDIVEVRGERIQELYEELVKNFSLPTTAGEKEVYIESENGHELIPRIVEAFPKGRFSSISLRESTLADSFLKITGKKLEDGHSN